MGVTFTHGLWTQQWNPHKPSRTVVGWVLTIMVHAGLVYVLVSGLGNGIVKIVRPPVLTKIIEETKPPPEPPPPTPSPQLVMPPTPPYIPPPEIQIEQPPPPQRAIAVVATVPPPVPVAPPVARPAPPAPAPVPDSEVSAKPIAGPPLVYPPRMLQAEREGKVDITCDVDTDGGTSNCAVTAAIGGSAFTDAAMAYVQQARYKPAVRNGVPVKEPHHTFHIIFALKD